MPKLNWSAPKDACWISATNSMECRSANDVYLLLKSSDFVVHDLEQVFEGVVAVNDNDDDKEDEEDEKDGEQEKEEEEEEEEEEGKEAEQEEEETDAPAIRRSRHQQQAYSQIPYHLILRKSIPALNPALEFRCFVRARTLLCLCQRDLNHYPFLPSLVPQLRGLIQDFFTKNLQTSFPDPKYRVRCLYPWVPA